MVSCAKMIGLILTIYASCDVFLHKEMPFWGCDKVAPHTGYNSPKPSFLGRE